MSNSIEVADIAKEINAINITLAKLTNVNNQINGSVKNITSKTNDIEKASSQSLKNLSQRINSLSNVVKVNINKSIKTTYVLTNIKNIITNTVSVKYHSAKDEIKDSDRSTAPPEDSEKNEGNKFILKLNSLVDKLNLLTVNFNLQPEFKINNTLSVTLTTLQEKVESLTLMFSFHSSLLSVSINLLTAKIEMMVSMLILQTSFIMGYFGQMATMLLSKLNAPDDKDDGGWFNKILNGFRDYETIKSMLLTIFPEGKWLKAQFKKLETGLGALILFFIKPIWSVVRVVFGFLIRAIFTALAAFFGSIPAMITAIVLGIGYLFYTFYDEILSGLKAVTNALIDAAKFMWDGICKVIRFFTIDLFKQAISGLSSIGQSISEWWSGDKSADINQASNELIKWQNGLTDNIKANNTSYFLSNHIPMMDMTPEVLMAASEASYTINSMPNIVINAQGLNNMTMQSIQNAVSSGVQHGEKELTQSINGGMP